MEPLPSLLLSQLKLQKHNSTKSKFLIYIFEKRYLDPHPHMHNNNNWLLPWISSGQSFFPNIGTSPSIKNTYKVWVESFFDIIEETVFVKINNMYVIVISGYRSFPQYIWTHLHFLSLHYCIVGRICLNLMLPISDYCYRHEGKLRSGAFCDQTLCGQ